MQMKSPHPRVILFVGVALVILGPAIIVLPAIWSGVDFSETGQVGDTIGGITAPVVNLLGAYLVYVAFRQQVNANQILQQQVSDQKTNRIEDNESTRLFQMYEHLVAAIDAFTFNGFDEQFLQNPGNTRSLHLRGTKPVAANAVYLMLDEIKCHYHGTEEELDAEVAVAEFTGILKLIELVTERLDQATGQDWPILAELVKHQFRYRIMVRFKKQSVSELKKWHCDVCDHDHGIPERMLSLIEAIEAKLMRLDARRNAVRELPRR
ncbi:MAG: hypothetical protein ABI599_10120 [Flavobacteriales bacterium]